MICIFMPSILSQNQIKILTLLSGEKSVTDIFYLSGGTVLAEFYLQHRLSEDLDFFSEHEFNPMFISAILKKIKEKGGILKINYEQSFNRNLYFLELKNDNIKTEFTYFPFTRIESQKKFGDLYIDSLIDIAVNKLFTIYQKPRSRDFIDLYFILMKEKSWNIDDLIKKSQIKFDTHINPIQLSGQFVKAETLKDYPRMVKDIDEKEWQGFFVKEARRLAELSME